MNALAGEELVGMLRLTQSIEEHWQVVVKVEVLYGILQPFKQSYFIIISNHVFFWLNPTILTLRNSGIHYNKKKNKKKTQAVWEL